LASRTCPVTRKSKRRRRAARFCLMVAGARVFFDVGGDVDRFYVG
jgi:hypothetical protein